jgi:hypothetical protein
MKKLLIIIFGAVVVVGLALVAVFMFTGGLTETADGFFQSVKDRDFAAARTYLSEEFKAGTDEVALKEFLASGSLMDVREANWSSREISGSRGELSGEVVTEAGGVVPLKVVLVKENDDWRIFSFEKPTAGIRTASNTSMLPAEPDQAALVKRSMRDFAVSVNAKDMTHFRNATAKLWQEQFTVARFNEVFGSIFEAGIDFTVLEEVEPLIDPVTGLAENDVLVLKGRFPTKPSQVFFEQKYVDEGTGWKLIGFDVNVQ